MKKLFRNKIGFEIELENCGNRIQTRVRFPFEIQDCLGFNKSLQTFDDIKEFKKELNEIMQEAYKINVGLYIEVWLREIGFREEKL